MLRAFFCFLLLAGLGRAAQDEHLIFRDVAKGWVAFCRPSEVDELQLIGDPRRLSNSEAKSLAAILTAEETWYEKLPDGSRRSTTSLCIPHYDFKFILVGEAGTTIAIRLCTSCSQVAVIKDGASITFPDLRATGMKALSDILEKWFPGWQTITQKNRAEWVLRKKNNEPTEPAESKPRS